MFTLTSKIATFFSVESSALSLDGEDKFYGKFIAVNNKNRGVVQVYFIDQNKGFEFETAHQTIVQVQ